MRARLGDAWRTAGAWLDGPASLIGEWRRSSGGGKPVQARLSDDGTTLILRSGGGESAVSLAGDDRSPHAAAALSGAVGGRTVEIVPPRAWIIERRIELPLEAADHLDGIVASRIGALSPLPAGEMLHGHRVVHSDRTEKRIGVVIALLPKARAAPLLERMEAAGARRAGLVAPLSQGGSVRLSTRRSDGPASSGAIRTLLALMLALSALAAVAGIGARLAYAGIEATQRAGLETRAAAARDRINGFLAPETAGTLPEQRALEIKNEAVSALGALDDLARALPDHSFTTEVSLRDGRLRIAGRTLDLPDVLTALESSGRFAESGLVGPATRGEDGLSSLFMLETRPLIRTGGALR